jgi:hypothetical protein
MYKKITHRIIEEHFDYLPAEIKRTYGNVRSTVGLPTAGKFKSDVDAYFSSLHSTLDNISTATKNGNMDTLLTEETAFFDLVDDLGKMLLPYYGIEFSERLNQVFRGLGLSFIGIGRNLKFKTDIKFITDRLDQNFDQLALLFNQYNNDWEYNSTKNAWFAIRDGLISEATAIMNGDNTAFVSAHTQTADKLTTFANALADSVIQQYPNKFIL